MKIERILDQMRRDFTAIYKCEHCGATSEGSGYDDAYFHKSVVPEMKCKECGEKSTEDFRPLTTKYPEGAQV